MMDDNYRIWKKDIADALLKYNNGQDRPITDENGYPEMMAVYEVEKALDSVPSAEEYPACWFVKKNEEGKVYLQCSRCRKNTYETVNRETQEPIRFCPYCGANCGTAT